MYVSYFESNTTAISMLLVIPIAGRVTSDTGHERLQCAGFRSFRFDRFGYYGYRPVRNI